MGFGKLLTDWGPGGVHAGLPALPCPGGASPFLGHNRCPVLMRVDMHDSSGIYGAPFCFLGGGGDGRQPKQRDELGNRMWPVAKKKKIWKRKQTPTSDHTLWTRSGFVTSGKCVRLYQALNGVNQNQMVPTPTPVTMTIRKPSLKMLWQRWSLSDVSRALKKFII